MVNRQNYETFIAACNYLTAGLEVIYDHPELKYPQIKDWQTKTFTNKLPPTLRSGY